MAEQMKQNKAGEMAAKQIIPAGYKLTEIGVIPSDWKVINGRELFVKIQDGTHFSPKVNGGEFLYITSKNIRNGFLDLKSADYIDKCQHEKIYRRCDVTINDILITKDGANTGNVCLNPLDEPFSLLSSVAFLRLNKKHHDPKFFVQQILSATFQSTIKDEMSGNAITRLTLGKINGLKFYVPELNEQKAIAGVLSDTDELIAGLEQLIAKKQAIKTATMQQLLTGRTRLPQFALRPDGTTKGYKTSELGQIPEDWDATTLGDISEVCMCKRIFSGQTVEVGEIPFYKIGTFGGEPDAYISVSLYKKFRDKYSFPEKGDILISAAGTLGKTVIYDGCPAYFQDSNIVWLKIDKSKICNEYLYHSYKLIRWASPEGSTISRLYNGIIRATMIVIPTLLEQTTIATILSNMDSELTVLEQKLAKARDVKQGMMQQLLTGRIRLPLEVVA
ncbi:TPA: restriction endonuclease subunit S [Aeromonas dhakensis]|nr:restriction endonuclease subunit S [Aeromonas dhakensis]